MDKELKIIVSSDYEELEHVVNVFLMNSPLRLLSHKIALVNNQYVATLLLTENKVKKEKRFEFIESGESVEDINASIMRWKKQFGIYRILENVSIQRSNTYGNVFLKMEYTQRDQT